MTFNVPELEEGKHATSSVSNHLNFYEKLMLGLNRVKLILFILGFFCRNQTNFRDSYWNTCLKIISTLRN